MYAFIIPDVWGPGETELFSLYQNKYITGCVLSSAVFRKQLLGTVCFLSEHPTCWKTSGGLGYLTRSLNFHPNLSAPCLLKTLNRMNNHTFRHGTNGQIPFLDLKNLNIIKKELLFSVAKKLHVLMSFLTRNLIHTRLLFHSYFFKDFFGW